MDRPGDSELRVLLVEDDDGDALLVEEMLRLAGEAVAVERARTLADARPLVHRADCALIDLGLPDAMGLDALAGLREAAPRMAMVVLTGLGDRTRGVEAVASGAQDYLVKGETDGVGLAKAIRYAVERVRAENAQHELVLAERREAENRRLSRGLLPLLQIDPTAVDVASRYRPSATSELGGDFFDALTLPDGTIRAMIGDVCGHGPAEAAVGVALRIAWRTMVLSGAPPDLTIETVDAVLRLEREDRFMFATLCDVTLDPGARRVQARRHGHPPPLLIGPSGARWLERADPAPPIGIDAHEPCGVEAAELPPGTAVLLLTDGIYEARLDNDRLDADQFVLLVAELRSHGLTGAPLLDQLLERTAAHHAGGLDDDVALMWLAPR